MINVNVTSFIHSQNFSATEIIAEDSCQENTSRGLSLFLLMQNQSDGDQTSVSVNTTYKCPFSPDVLRLEEKKAAVKQVSDNQPGATDEKEQEVMVW